MLPPAAPSGTLPPVRMELRGQLRQWGWMELREVRTRLVRDALDQSDAVGEGGGVHYRHELLHRRAQIYTEQTFSF